MRTNGVLENRRALRLLAGVGSGCGETSPQPGGNVSGRARVVWLYGWWLVVGGWVEDGKDVRILGSRWKENSSQKEPSRSCSARSLVS